MGMFPDNYFNKYIKITLGVLLLLTLASWLVLNNYSLSNKAQFQICCNEKEQCINPFYYCEHTVTNFIQATQSGCLDYQKLGCPNNICDSQYIQPNQCIKSSNKKNYDTLILVIYFVILTLGFIINHIVYKMKNHDNN